MAPARILQIIAILFAETDFATFQGKRSVAMQAIHLQGSTNNVKRSVSKDPKIMSNFSHIHLGQGKTVISPTVYISVPL